MKHFAWNDLRDIVTCRDALGNTKIICISTGAAPALRFASEAVHCLPSFLLKAVKNMMGFLVTQIHRIELSGRGFLFSWMTMINLAVLRTHEQINKVSYLFRYRRARAYCPCRKTDGKYQTGLSLHSFDVDGEILMPVVEPIKKRIEFVGDSITCGFGLGTSEKDRFYYPQEENVWMAHGPTAARCLGMDWQMICISGICLAPRKEIPMPVAMNMLYEYTDRPAQQALELDADHWNFKEHPVDYVVINLGTNDATAASFSAAPKKIEEQYEKDYVHFLKTVRKCNGDKTKIICALGSMDYYFYDAMNRAVDTYRAETGDNNVYTFKYCRMSPMDPIGACGHPSELTQQKMAKELVAFIQALEKRTVIE